MYGHGRFVTTEKVLTESKCNFFSQTEIVDVVIAIFFRDYFYAVTYLSWSLMLKMRTCGLKR